MFFENFIFVLKNTCCIYIFWIAVHYVTPHLYTYYCTPLTWTGFFLSPIMAVSPQCEAIRWAMLNSGDIIKSLWWMTGAWIASLILLKK